MGVNPKEKAALQENWNKAQAGGGSDIPDGTYQFVIVSARFHMGTNGRPQFRTKLRIKGGAEEYVGKELEINDNLETPENMGWFKKKLTRLNIAMPEDFDDVTDGTLAEQMAGKVFEGQAKTKNDFLNVYVNRLIGEDRSAAEEQLTGEETGHPEAPEPDGFEDGSNVTWNGRTGTVIEHMDDGKYRVKGDDGKTYRVDAKLLQAVETEEQVEVEETVEAEEPEAGQNALPTPEEVESLPATQVKQVLKDLGLDAAKVKTPRAVLHGISTLLTDPKGKIELTEIAPLAFALNVTIKKGTPIKDATKALSKAVQELVG